MGGLELDTMTPPHAVPETQTTSPAKDGIFIDVSDSDFILPHLNPRLL